MTDIIDRLEDDEMYIDAIGDAIAEIRKLRVALADAATAMEKIDSDVDGMLDRKYRQILSLRAALQPFADAAQYVDEPMYTQDRYVAGLNTVEQYHEARRVLGGVKG